MHLSQEQYIRELLQKTTMLHSKPKPTPMASSSRLKQNSSEHFHDPSLYQSVVGALQYLLITRPKLSYSVNRACQFMHDLKLHHWQVVKRILHYLGGTITHAFLLRHNLMTFLIGFANADWVLTLITVNPLLAIVFTWDLILFHGHPTSRKRLLEVV